MNSRDLVMVAVLSGCLCACSEVTSDPGVTKEGSKAVDAEIKRMKAEAAPIVLTPAPTYTPPYQTKEWEAVRRAAGKERGVDWQEFAKEHERQMHEREQDARLQALENQ